MTLASAQRLIAVLFVVVILLASLLAYNIYVIADQQENIRWYQDHWPAQR